MAEQIIKNEEQVLQNLSSIDTKVLLQYLHKGFEITIKQVNFLAKIWYELEKRGEDLTNLKASWLASLPLVAQGKLEPAVMVNYSGRKSIITAMSALPLSKQQELTTQKTVSVARLKADGKKFYPVDIEISALSMKDIHQVFDVRKGEVLSFENQVRKLQKKKTPKSRQKNLNFDGKNLNIGMHKVNFQQVLKTVHAYYEQTVTLIDDVPKNIPTLIHITTPEAQNLQKRIKLASLSQEDYLYTILKSFGCFEDPHI